LGVKSSWVFFQHFNFPSPVPTEGHLSFHRLTGARKVHGHNHQVGDRGETEPGYFLLSPGDSLFFAANLRHHWRNAGQGLANVLILLSGFSESDHPLSTHMPKQTC